MLEFLCYLHVRNAAFKGPCDFYTRSYTLETVVSALQRSILKSVMVCFHCVYSYVSLLFMSDDNSFPCTAIVPKFLLKNSE